MSAIRLPATSSRLPSCAPGIIAAVLLALPALYPIASAAPATAAAAASLPVPVVRAVASVAVPVSDMRRSLSFYHDVLGFETVGDREVTGDAYEHLYGVFGARVRIVTLQLGDEQLQLEQFIAPAGRSIPEDSRSNDGWFQHVAIIVSDLDRAYALLRAHQVRHGSTGPQLLPHWNVNAAGIGAFYFRDPDDHNLEVLHFPPGKGNAKWQNHPERLFLGIDHTAIVVADTEASLKYYRDALGLKIAGSSENYGVEQEHLNNVFGARLRITALRAALGPGVELLEYLAPRTGRQMPVDTLANDLWSWHVTMQADVQRADAAVRAQHFSYVSPGPVQLDALTPLTGLLLRDPDGHATLLLQGP
ncbi:MAG: VOC family protein [Steroidobacteraceae bacterium]